MDMNTEREYSVPVCTGLNILKMSLNTEASAFEGSQF